MRAVTRCDSQPDSFVTTRIPLPVAFMRCAMAVIRTGRAHARNLLVGSLLTSATAAGAHAQDVGEYQGTTFVHGIASNGLMWEVPYAPLANQSVQGFLLSTLRIQLGAVRSPETDPNVLSGTGGDRFARQVENLRDSIGLRSDRSVIVAHSLGGIIARDLYISHPASRPSIAGIVTVATLHQGADIANYRVPLNQYFIDLQKSVNEGIDAAKWPVILVGLFGGAVVGVLVGGIVAPWVWTSVSAGLGANVGARLGLWVGLGAAILTSNYKIDGQGIPNLAQLSGITQLNVLKDMAPDRPEYQANPDLDFSHIRRLNTRTDDSAVARASVVADWGNQSHAPIRLFKAVTNDEGGTEELIRQRNQAVKLMNVCRHVNRWIFRKRDARKCHRAQNMLKSLDEVWARYITGEVTVYEGRNAVKRPRYGKWDGVVRNETQRYPGLSDPQYLFTVSGLNHVNVYKHDRGARTIGAAMLKIGMVPVSSVGTPAPPPTSPAPPPPPAPLSVAINGNAAVQPFAACAFRAVVSDGTAPYAYSWTPTGATVNSSVTLGNDSNAFNVVLRVTDASGRTGSATLAVTVSSTAPACPIAPALN